MDFSLDRESTFSFTCRVCGRCCTNKLILAGPHEVLGMSRVLGVSTTEFLARHTENGGTTLRSEADGRCVFVTASGCRVHPWRPLVCRLYPLGRMTDALGKERFALSPREHECETEVGYDGTVASFLESQGVGPYLDWSRRYGELYRRMVGLLERLDVVGEVDAASGNDGTATQAPLSSWQDIDGSLAEYCVARGVAAPLEIEKAITLHIQAMEEWLDDLEFRIGMVRNDP